MPNFMITESEQDILICFDEHDDTLIKVLQATYMDNGEVHYSRTLDMTQANDLITHMSRTLKELKELQVQIIKNSYKKFVAANESD